MFLLLYPLMLLLPLLLLLHFVVAVAAVVSLVAFVVFDLWVMRLGLLIVICVVVAFPVDDMRFAAAATSFICSTVFTARVIKGGSLLRWGVISQDDEAVRRL